MKTRTRSKAYRLWRAGHVGLVRLQTLVDQMLASAEANNELPMSGLPDLKLRVNKEVRDNAAFEVRYRREMFEMEDLELARAAGVPIMLKIKADLEAQVQRLLDLHDLGNAVGLRPVIAATSVEAPQEQPQPPAVEPQSVAYGPPVEPAADGETLAPATEAPHEALASSETHDLTEGEEDTTAQAGPPSDALEDTETK